MTIKTKEQWEEYLARCTAQRLSNKPSKHIEKRNAQYLKQLRSRFTEAEKEFGYILCDLGIPFIFQKGFFKPFHRIVDFYIPKKSLAFEIDGGYHKDREQKDKNKDDWFFKSRGLEVVRIKNEDVSNWETNARVQAAWNNINYRAIEMYINIGRDWDNYKDEFPYFGTH